MAKDEDFTRNRIRVVLVFGHEVPFKLRAEVEEMLDAFMRTKIEPLFIETDWRII